MEQIKILVLGAAGMAGHVIARYFGSKENYKVFTLARNCNSIKPDFEVDLKDFEALTKVLEKGFDVVINGVGLLNQYAENNPDEAILINSYLPHFLAKKSTALNYKFIHISTDCVFSGAKGKYTEDSFKDGVGFYAQTKALGEVTYGDNLTIRTSIIGPELKNNGIGLFDWFMKQKGETNGYSKSIWSGVTTPILAEAIEAAIINKVTGLVHLSNNDGITKYDLLKVISIVFEKDIVVHKVDGVAADKSILDTQSKLNYQVPSYPDMIVHLKNWITNSEDYS
ncbi:SDR family oxidoreductase [Persicobacter diffluens]|uniref:dTDP-4-dehydrorhamnose reductase n=1 Tax=Persicobacter diffluens TaxID=981 RepID=A0AAN4VXW5_9BACT|nr:NAD(P)-dependent oxidoreductase [Persicobacter diffluens]